MRRLSHPAPPTSPTLNGSPNGRAPSAAARVETLPRPFHTLVEPESKVYVGDCRGILPYLAEVRKGRLDLVFADPPFNWNRAYDQWRDDMPRGDYLKFTREWLDLCVAGLRPGGAIWVNIPDDTAAEIVVHLKSRDLEMVNWCIWHYRFGQNTTGRFINSKVHALYFVKPGAERTWNREPILELSDRRAIYFDPRTESKKDGMPPGLRLPMDVWYGRNWGRVQGNNKERRHQHDNQLPEVYLARVLLACSNPGDLVLDPFLGSGTTGVVARALGRRFIGIEYSRANARRACSRIEQGPIRSLQPAHQSTAIHPPRRRRRAPKA
jgi:site-specific DNA-methyltransferase (adenine-specific)